MTTEIEKKFFEKWGIDKKCNYVTGMCDPMLPIDFDYDNTDRDKDCEYCERCVFPTITAEIEDKLEKIILNHYRELCFDYWNKEKCLCVEESFYICGCKKYSDIYSYPSEYIGKAETKKQALLSLFNQLDETELGEEVRRIFK